MQICKNILTSKNCLFQSSQFAYFHSTPASFAKWKKKWTFTDTEEGQPHPKIVVKFATRQNRAARRDAKRALKNIVFTRESPNIPFEDGRPICRNSKVSNGNLGQDSDSNCSSKKPGTKKSHRSPHARKNHSFGSYRKSRRESFDDFDLNSERIFRAASEGRRFTWSFTWEDLYSRNPNTGFEWRDYNPNWRNDRRKTWNASSESEDDNEPCGVGSLSDRTILGLPVTGPLKMEDVKSAFRTSALKWHPDKHQGPSQAVAEEKFKVCNDAYKSLCNALSST
ncbi:hypothetical protein MKW94_027188 [Papaver nudicaule]|uniref:J domain-containing protein n=1 Tax=Papaver nudicaule TaxID=74823 RepID=A0AA41VW22_PAPNU|nr:hypothetical protein [Papaver nudicaule]